MHNSMLMVALNDIKNAAVDHTLPSSNTIRLEYDLILKFRIQIAYICPVDKNDKLQLNN